MPTNYNGNDGAVTARAAVQISVPADADPQNAAAYNPALQELADIADHLETKAGLIDVASTWTVAQTFSGGIAGNTPLTGSNPVHTTGFTNTLTPASLAKAWCFGTVTNPSGTPVMTINAGLNIASITIPGGSGFTVTFATPMANPYYWVMGQSRGSPSYLAVITSVNPAVTNESTFPLGWYQVADSSGGGPGTLFDFDVMGSSNAFQFGFCVMGIQ